MSTVRGYPGDAGLGARLTLARAIRFVAMVAAGLVVVGILLVLLEANRSNDIVAALLDAAGWLAGPFENLFTLDDRDAEIAVNWGIAAAVYAVVGSVIARLLIR